MNIDLSHDKFTGTIPDSLYKFSSLRRLLLAVNQFQGKYVQRSALPPFTQSVSQPFTWTDSRELPETRKHRELRSFK